MSFNDRVQFVAIITLAFSVTAALVASLQSFSYLLFSAFAIVEFLLIVEMTTPGSYRPAWMKPLDWLIGVGLIGMTGLAVWYILQIIPIEIV